LALRNSVREDRVTHAYLFSGPRGTGKTSTARILAKALNCQNPSGGEPCGACDSCIAITAGSSLDVHEMDAASNNGVEAIRDLVARTALGTPGRWKVYIVDEVHMLSAAASNALLKTLEEPPGHVVFVLATTDPQKVLPTIRSRTHHFEFRLLGPVVLGELVDQVRLDAGLDVGRDAVDVAVRKANGSALDALSVLDQVAVTGAIEDEVAVLDELAEALCEKDTGRALVAVAEAAAAGRDAGRLATDILDYLRQGFLATMAPRLVTLPDSSRVLDQARRLGPAALVRAMEVLGTTLVEMRDSLDPRLGLDVALVRLTNPEADDSVSSLAERLHRLERRLGGQADAIAAPGPPQVPATPSRPADGPRAALGAIRRTQSTAGPGGAGPIGGEAHSGEVHSGEVLDATRSGAPPSRDQLVKAWGDEILASLTGRARALYRSGRFVAMDSGTAMFALPDETHRSYSEACRQDVETAVSKYFGSQVSIQLVVDGESPGSAPPATRAARGMGSRQSGASRRDDEADLEETFDPEGLSEPISGLASAEERLLQVFPGAEEVSDQ
ncbi:MAG: DNA polymerase III subunit gamma/tau, partial [Acidimicrobiales bacterium]